MPTAQQDREARPILLVAYATQGLPEPTMEELQVAQAVARFDGKYGLGWRGVEPPPHNWGAIQCGHKAPCGEGCFEYGDRHGDGQRYRACFRRYPNRVSGAADLLHQLYRRPGVPEAMRRGDVLATAKAMKASRYFEADAEAYALQLKRHAAQLAAALDEPDLTTMGSPATSARRWWPWVLVAAAAAAAYYGSRDG